MATLLKLRARFVPTAAAAGAVVASSPLAVIRVVMAETVAVYGYHIVCSGMTLVVKPITVAKVIAVVAV